jgi:RimJ/RimL family protein N-acetyltransferase
MVTRANAPILVVVELRPPEPDLTDGVVTLRQLEPSYVTAITAACQDPEILRWTTEIPEGYTEEHARAWIASARDGWKEGRAELAITVEGAFAGAIGLVSRHAWAAEIGYWVAPEFRRRSLATRALELISQWAEDVGFARLQLTMFPGNEASARVAEKAGFVEEGLLRAYANQRGTIRDARIWSRVC